ncbi:hypothetical protein VB264_11735 [Arcicella aquatica]|uniref:Lipopolysaccharide biosynthesis protein n=1 Tax=Arcicella aquatica TaxID=217141 RepID=A0ABU5QNG4_9BACT|nr:hypothetical protein [Arcicella aquatica]MEA5258455.1 hypothetical protein [Arcicella aquatica]
MKHILFISPTTAANIYQVILDEFNLYQNSIKTDFLSNVSPRYRYRNKGQRIINFLSKIFLNRNIKEVYHRKIMQKRFDRLENHYDLIFVIRPDLLTNAELSILKRKTTKLIAYYWDTMSFFPRKKDIMTYFDKVYSFDLEDCKTYNLELLTNFYYFEPQPVPIDKTVFCISHLEKKRFEMFNAMGKYLEAKKISYRFLTRQSKEKLKSPYIEYLKESIPYQEMLKLLNHYEIILDIAKPNQHGLSFRIFESLGMNKKIITNNQSVKAYDFYHPNNIMVIDFNKLDIPEAFFKTPYKHISDEIKLKYHLKFFVKKVLSNLN